MISQIGKYYLYAHYRKDSGQPFYIGIGSKKEIKTEYKSLKGEYQRAYIKKGRTNAWKNIVNKCGYEVEILLESEDYEFIKQKEIEFIALYGRRDLGTGTLVNLTDGGDGTVGCKRSDEYKENARKKGFPPTEFSIVDSKGKIYKGKNIKKFCKENNLSHSLIYKMIIKGGKSQGYYANYEEYLKSKVVIVNLRTNTVYKTNNIKEWCIKNQPNLLDKRGYPDSICRLLLKETRIYSKTWWACYESEWKGYIEIDSDVYLSKYYVVIDANNNEIVIENALEFCKTHKLNISGFYDMLSGNRTYHKQYRILKTEYIFKNISDDKKRITIS